jgi:hypothetical protein
MANRSRFTKDQRLELLANWQRSGLPAPDFAGTIQGLTAQMLYNWRFHLGGTKQPLGRPTIDGYGVVEPVMLDAATHRELAARAALASKAAGRVVEPAEYAESIIRNYLIAASTCDRLRTHDSPTGSSRGAKGSGRKAGRDGRGKDGAAAARRAGPKVRARTRRRKGAGQADGSGSIRGVVQTTRPIHQFEYQD